MGDDVHEPWRNQILERVKAEANKSKPFDQIFESYRNVCDSLSRAVENDARRRKATGITGGTTTEEAADLQLQLDELQRTHAEMLKKKEVNDQRLITAKYDLERLEKEKTIVTGERDAALRKVEEVEQKRKEVLEENARVKASDEETNKAMQALKDEHMVLQMLHQRISEDLKKCELERDDLLERLKELKMKQVEFFNMEAEREEQRQYQRKMELINEAIKTNMDMNEGKGFELVDPALECPSLLGDVLPSHLHSKIEGHDSEVTDLTWLHHGETLFSASSDHTILEYDITGSVPVKVAKFTGSTQGIMRLDINQEQNLVLGACNDKVLRIWSIADQRCRHELTGHTDKVVTAKFLANGAELASGSSDRTVKIWDLRQRRCVRTNMVGSSVFDLVTNDKVGAPIISGHFDKKIRFWDGRAEGDVETIIMENKITSLFISSDGLNLLCATRDETLSLIDLRTMQTIHVYSAEQYRTTSDYSKCCISPGMQYIAAGSLDGNVFVWNLRSTKLEKVLSKGHSGSAVLSIAWHPRGNVLISGDKKKTVCVWR